MSEGNMREENKREDKSQNNNLGKNQNRNELIERYIYDVTRRLPENTRKDIGEELRSLIEDMAEEQDLKDVLHELGDPAILARKYRGEKDSLISGEYYDLYWFVMKIVLICTGGGLAVATVTGWILNVSTTKLVFTNEAGTILSGFEITNGLEQIAASWPITGLASIVGVLMQVFAIITIIFILLEKYNVKVIRQNGILLIDGEADAGSYKTEWDIGKLPPIPLKKAVIKKGDEIADLVFAVIMTVIFIAVPGWLGVWVWANGSDASVVQIIPIFNLSAWGILLPTILFTVLLGITKSIVKLTQGCYNIPVAVATAGADLVSFIVWAIILKAMPVWNPDFVTSVGEAFGKVFDAKGDIMSYWNTPVISNIILAILAFSFVLETGEAIVRAMKYRKTWE